MFYLVKSAAAAAAFSALRNINDQPEKLAFSSKYLLACLQV
jgi:hypothetical protein